MAVQAPLTARIFVQIGDAEPSELGEITIDVSFTADESAPAEPGTALLALDVEAARESLEAVMPETHEPVLPHRMIGSPLDISPDPQRAAALAKNAEVARTIEPDGLLDGPEHVIFGGRQEGKTHLAVEWLDATPRGSRRVLIVPDVRAAEQINARLFPYGDAEAMSYRQLLNRGAEAGVEYGIDETVMILSNLLGLREPPRLVTMVTAAPWQGTPPEFDTHSPVADS